MVNIAIKNTSRELLRTVKNQAKLNHRSVNGEMIFTLKMVFGFQQKPDSEDLLREARDSHRGQGYLV